MMGYLMNVLVAWDQLLSAYLGGDEDETISSRLGKAERGDFGRQWQLILTPVAKLVDLAFRPFEGRWDHCRRHIEEDEGKAELLLDNDNDAY